MHTNNVAIAEAYYTAMASKNSVEMEKYLHPHAQLIGPLSNLSGKEAILEAAQKAFVVLKRIVIRAKFGFEDHVMLAYDWDFNDPIGNLRAAVLMTFQDNFITKIELFFDARAFMKK